MNWKLVVLGGLVYYVATFAVTMVTGPLIHEGVLDEAYAASESFWQPALTEDPPDMASLMPRWIATGLFNAMVLAAIYGCVRSSFKGPGWKRGLWYGLILSGVYITALIGWSGVFYLPNQIWMWWGLEQFLYHPLGCAAMGAVAAKVAPHAD